ncbi:MAG: NUDIX domain-containing protein [Patescibacteria group bacterium]
MKRPEIRIYVSPHLYLRIAEYAEEIGLNVTDYVKHLIIEKVSPLKSAVSEDHTGHRSAIIEDMNNKEASLVILSYKRKLLLILRDNKPDIVSPNHWAFPGGIREKDESFVETAIREVNEELNIKISELEFIIELKYLDKTKKLYFAPLSNNQVDSIELHEGQRYALFSPNEAQKLLLARSTKLFFDSHFNLIKERLIG